MTSKIKFVRGSLTKVSHPTTFLNKTKKVSLNRNGELENYILTTKDTSIECITAEQDFNYFLAKGVRQVVNIDTCQLGFPFTESFLLSSSCYHKCNLEYTVKPGLVVRTGGEFYTSFVRGAEIILNPSTIDENTVNFQINITNTANLSGSFSLVTGDGSTDNSSFSIVNNRLQYNGSPNYEAKNQYFIRLRAVFSNFSTEQTFSININDLNEAPTAIFVAGVPVSQPTGATFIPTQAYTNFSIPGVAQDMNGQISQGGGGSGGGLGGSGGYGGGGSFSDSTGQTFYALFVLETNPNPTIIASLDNNDPDNNTVSVYELVPGVADTDNSVFSILGNVLSINITTDYEVKKEYFIRVKVTTNGGLSTEIPLRVNVVQLSEAPVNILLSPNNLGSLNSVIGGISTVDPDNFSSFTYSVIGGGLANRVSISGNSLVLSAVLDGSETDYTVIIKSTDQSNLNYQKQFNLTYTGLTTSYQSLNSELLDTYAPVNPVNVATLIVDSIPVNPQPTPTNNYILLN